MVASLTDAELGSIKRILFVRSDRIGDAIVSTPALQALRHRFPGAEIDIVLGRRNAAAAPLLPFVDRVLIADHALAMARIVWTMRRRRYDVAINPLRSPSTTAALLTTGSGARTTVGCASAFADRYDIASPQPDIPTHFVKRYMLPLAALGIAMPDDAAIRLSVQLPREACEKARALFGPHSGAPQLLVNISSSSREKFWGVENFARLAGQMKTDGFDAVIAAAPGDDTLLQAIAAQSGARALPPQASLTDFTAVLSCADLIVSPDTSVVHLAAALGKPVVALEPTARNVIEWHPWGVPHRALSFGSGIPDIPCADVAAAVRSLAADVF